MQYYARAFHGLAVAVRSEFSARREASGDGPKTGGRVKWAGSSRGIRRSRTRRKRQGLFPPAAERAVNGPAKCGLARARIPTPVSAMNFPSKSAAPPPRRLAITVRGVVQGVGFRPFVYNAARDGGLPAGCGTRPIWCGSKCRASRRRWRRLSMRFATPPPPQARVDAVEVEEIGPLEDCRRISRFA